MSRATIFLNIECFLRMECDSRMTYNKPPPAPELYPASPPPHQPSPHNTRCASYRKKMFDICTFMFTLFIKFAVRVQKNFRKLSYPTKIPNGAFPSLLLTYTNIFHFETLLCIKLYLIFISVASHSLIISDNDNPQTHLHGNFNPSPIPNLS